jgi:type I restriction enzyme S subunit
MKQGKMSETRLSGLKDEQDVGTKKILQSFNQVNPDADNLKQGWEIKRLEDVVGFQRGLTYSKKDEVDFSDNIVLRSNNVDLFRNQLDFSELKYINPSIEIPENKKVKKGSLLICTANGSKSHLGKVALIDDDYNYAFGGFMGLINPKQKLDSKFLFYLMTSDNYKKFIYELSDGANINNLKFGDLGQFEIPLPPLPEQQRIVSILDECFSAIEHSRNNAERCLSLSKALFESYLQGVFDPSTRSGQGKQGDGWEEKKLGEVCKYDKNQNIHKGLPYVGLEHIESNSSRFLGSIEPQEVKSSTFHFDEQHILYGRLRPYLNKVLLPDFEGHCSTEIFPIKPSKQVAREFLFYWLIAGSTVKKIDATWTGARMPRANMNQVLEFDFALPPLQAQQTIVRQLDALRAETQKLEAVYLRKIEGLDELKKSILQKAFAGELRGGEPAEPKTEVRVLERNINS